jgi:hypothetical protein
MTLLLVLLLLLLLLLLTASVTATAAVTTDLDRHAVRVARRDQQHVAVRRGSCISIINSISARDD